MNIKIKYKLGKKVTDKLSGFKGVITGVVIYDSGLISYGIQGKLDKDGCKPSLKWVDEGHLK